MRAAPSAILAIGLFFIPAALGHAGITSPPIRQPGKAFLDKCGQPSFNSVKGDATGHIEEQEPVKAGCELTLCRGMVGLSKFVPTFYLQISSAFPRSARFERPTCISRRLDDHGRGLYNPSRRTCQCVTNRHHWRWLRDCYWIVPQDFR